MDFSSIWKWFTHIAYDWHHIVLAVLFVGTYIGAQFLIHHRHTRHHSSGHLLAVTADVYAIIAFLALSGYFSGSLWLLLIVAAPSAILLLVSNCIRTEEIPSGFLITGGNMLLQLPICFIACIIATFFGAFDVTDTVTVWFWILFFSFLFFQLWVLLDLDLYIMDYLYRHFWKFFWALFVLLALSAMAFAAWTYWDILWPLLSQTEFNFFHIAFGVLFLGSNLFFLFMLFTEGHAPNLYMGLIGFDLFFLLGFASVSWLPTTSSSFVISVLFSQMIFSAIACVVTNGMDEDSGRLVLEKNVGVYAIFLVPAFLIISFGEGNLGWDESGCMVVFYWIGYVTSCISLGLSISDA